MRNLSGTSLVKIVALALSIVCTQSATAQHFKQVSVTGGAKLVQIASGGRSVWARARNGKPYIFRSNTFVLANSISLTQIAVGGGNAVKGDTVWGLDSSGLIYHATASGTSWVFSQVPGVLDFIAVGIGYDDSCHPYEVWGLNPAAEIYRYSFCSKLFEQVPGTLATLAVGGGDIWGINGDGKIFNFNFATHNFDLGLNNNNAFSQVTVGPNGVWALDGQTDVWQIVQVGVALNVLVHGPLAQIQAGGDGVWGINTFQQVFRLEQLHKVQIPGAALVSISVGSGGGVWGINDAGQSLAFITP
jgi:hypothetical protein